MKLMQCLGLISVLSALSCGSRVIGSVEQSEDALSGTFDIRTWWSSRSETLAIQELNRAFSSRFPQVTMLRSNRSADEQRDSLWVDVKDNRDPPDTFPCLLGEGCVYRYVRYEENGIAKRLFDPLDEIADRFGWREQFPQPVLEGAMVDGSLYAVPLDIHRINTVIYNIKLFQTHQVAIPKTLDELVAACEKFKAANVVPIAGSAEGWTISGMLLDSLFPAVAGGDVEATRSFLRGESELGDEDPRFLELLRRSAEIMKYVDIVADHSWDRATGRVGLGEAAMIFMGDWAQGELDASYDYGKDYGVFPAPGAGDVFVFNSDAFPIVSGAKRRDLAEAWLTFIADPQSQVLFNRIKGGIPARAMSPNELAADNAYGRAALTQFNDPNIRKAGALSTVVPLDFEKELNSVMVQFAATLATGPDTRIIKDFFHQNYDSLRRR